MKALKLVIILFSLSIIVRGLEAANTSTTTDNTPYCLSFTWLGPLYDSSSDVNVTCDDFSDTPCIEPFIVSTDGTEPNITYMWETYNHSLIGCPLRAGFSCIKYTYSFDDAPMNASYFCGKMIQDSSTALSSGCYTEETGGYKIEACACRTLAGGLPCNSSAMSGASFLTQSLTIFLLIFYSNKDLVR